MECNRGTALYLFLRHRAVSDSMVLMLFIFGLPEDTEGSQPLRR